MQYMSRKCAENLHENRGHLNVPAVNTPPISDCDGQLTAPPMRTPQVSDKHCANLCMSGARRKGSDITAPNVQLRLPVVFQFVQRSWWVCQDQSRTAAPYPGPNPNLRDTERTCIDHLVLGLRQAAAKTIPNQRSQALLIQQTCRGSFAAASKPIFVNEILSFFRAQRTILLRTKDSQ